LGGSAGVDIVSPIARLMEKPPDDDPPKPPEVADEVGLESVLQNSFSRNLPTKT
jgi:hypothetical protein